MVVAGAQAHRASVCPQVDPLDARIPLYEIGIAGEHTGIAQERPIEAQGRARAERIATFARRRTGA